MVTIEQKLELFSKLLDQTMNTRYVDELNALEKESQSKIQKAKEEVDKQAQDIEARAIKKAELKHAESISKSKVIIKRDIMSVKEKYFGIFMDSFKARIIDFVQSNDYKTFLSKNISKLNEELEELKEYDNLVLNIYLSIEDFSKYGDFIREEISKNYKVSLKTFDIIGGFIAEVPSKNIKFDISIDVILEDNKSLIMQTLFEALEAGDYND